jgi:hypothetical protein
MRCTSFIACNVKERFRLAEVSSATNFGSSRSWWFLGRRSIRFVRRLSFLRHFSSMLKPRSPKSWLTVVAGTLGRIRHLFARRN